MGSEENPGVNSKGRQPIDDQAKRNDDCQTDLIGMNVRKNQILPNKSWGNRKTGKS